MARRKRRARAAELTAGRRPQWIFRPASAVAVFSLVGLVGSLQPNGTAAPVPGTPVIPEIPVGTPAAITTAWGVVSAIFAPTWIAHDS